MTGPVASEARSAARRPAVAERRMLALDAFLDLLLEGHLPPTSEQVADRAGISMATLFRYFDTLDELKRDAAARILQRFSHLYQLPDIGAGPRDERIDRFVAIRVDLWEMIHPLAKLTRSNALRDPGAAETVESGRVAMADQIRLHFGVEHRALTFAQRENAVATIASLTSVESWEQFRHTHGRSAAQTRRAWSHAIDRILEARGPSSASS